MARGVLPFTDYSGWTRELVRRLPRPLLLTDGDFVGHWLVDRCQSIGIANIDASCRRDQIRVLIPGRPLTAELYIYRLTTSVSGVTSTNR